MEPQVGFLLGILRRQCHHRPAQQTSFGRCVIGQIPTSTSASKPRFLPAYSTFQGTTQQSKPNRKRIYNKRRHILSKSIDSNSSPLTIQNRASVPLATILLRHNNHNRLVVAARQFSTSAPAMSSDDAYAAFLDKANQDPSAGISSTQSQSGSFGATKTRDEGENVPAVLNDVEEFYVSDTDEAFESVALRWEAAKEGKWPSEEQFGSLISASSASIEIQSLKSFDPKDQYQTVVHAVRAAVSTGSSGEVDSNAEVKVYRVGMTETRAEYWVLGLERKGAGRIVGLKARAVES